MTYIQAALAILSDSRRPLSTREIASMAISRRLIEPKGKTPEASMSAALYAYAHGNVGLVKLGRPGPKRSARGSVKWSLRKT